ncbi:hypothetical protein AMECASPLE_027444 [Ameca splendens]|uniref:Uncharacterized protein n=1 Tax=Ameca splendens TaxID=208324 RepID=A0ABV0ZE39_9TELE
MTKPELEHLLYFIPKVLKKVEVRTVQTSQVSPHQTSSTCSLGSVWNTRIHWFGAVTQYFWHYSVNTIHSMSCIRFHPRGSAGGKLLCRQYGVCGPGLLL